MFDLTPLLQFLTSC